MEFGRLYPLYRPQNRNNPEILPKYPIFSHYEWPYQEIFDLGFGIRSETPPPLPSTESKQCPQSSRYLIARPELDVCENCGRGRTGISGVFSTAGAGVGGGVGFCDFGICGGRGAA